MLLRNTTHFVTRRCAYRRFMLRPGTLPNKVMGYILARAASQHHILVHVFCFMSNHLHLVVTDPEARLPQFMQDLDSLLGRALNKLHGQRDHFWEGGTYNSTALDSAEVIVDRCAYALANPVAAGLVRRGKLWPGLWSAPSKVGTTLRFERPGIFFRKRSTLPETASLELAVPPGFLSAEAFRSQLTAALAEQEARAAERHHHFLGLKRVLAQPLLDQPRAPERLGNLKPRFAAKDHGRRLELARQLKVFLADYWAAMLAWKAGVRRVIFPEGTYHMRVAHQAVCAGAG